MLMCKCHDKVYHLLYLNRLDSLYHTSTIGLMLRSTLWWHVASISLASSHRTILTNLLQGIFDLSVASHWYCRSHVLVLVWWSWSVVQSVRTTVLYYILINVTSCDLSGLNLNVTWCTWEDITQGKPHLQIPGRCKGVSSYYFNEHNH